MKEQKPDGHAALDAAGVGMRGNCSAINRAGEELLGHTREAMRTINLAELVVPEHRPLLTRMLERKLANGGATTYELDVTTRDGRRLTLEVRTRLILKDGKPVAVQGVAHEVTERKRAEEARKRLTAILEATAEAALREREALLRNVINHIPYSVFWKDWPGVNGLNLSFYTDDAVLRYGVREAEVAFLQKPFTGAVLACKVRGLLDG